ncbi:multiheme c-type cytochrome [Deferribacter desulfuricans SSM1]|uniref:Multiheme c-type cytochrome n=1 Tax=Deferribacter desulfuricans (strain DSM 14783 / JCM 11476 / NBRC 101012 / SSM1) TaxID=639282 RepID=D3PC34_DEFDS|nr:selenite/tellurite reduction operon c-type cytochrome lipoprotein ExtS [Deferribacter desulfuricans]BAI80157.1 multiheme c-type cytochrome [Deferribacter desulfuricans SSM1]
MAINRFLILIIFVAINAYSAAKCVKCHTVHYEKIGSCSVCHRGIEKSSRQDIAHYRIIKGKYSYYFFDNSTRVTKGYELIELGHCRRCHIIAGKGNLLAINLDLSWNYKSDDEIFDSIKKPNNFMPDFRFSDEQIVYIINAIYNGAKNNLSKKIVEVIHINKGDEKEIFKEKCGGCHKVLSKNSGPLGEGVYGPNLSGLFSKYYYKINDRFWDYDLFKKWLKNTRDVKKNSLMPNLILKDDEIKKIYQVIK